MGGDYTLQDFLIDLEERLFNWSRELHRVACISAYQIGSAWMRNVARWRRDWENDGCVCEWRSGKLKTQVRTCRVEGKCLPKTRSCDVKQCESCGECAFETNERSGRWALQHYYARISHLRARHAPIHPLMIKHEDKKDRNIPVLKVLTCHIAKKIRDTQRTRDSM